MKHALRAFAIVLVIGALGYSPSTTSAQPRVAQARIVPAASARLTAEQQRAIHRDPTQRANHPRGFLSAHRDYREYIGQYSAALEQVITRENATPGMALIPVTPGIDLVQTRQGNYKQRITPQFTVTGLGSSGQLDLVMLLPVSGHVGQANAERYARTNTYNVVVTHPDGTRQELPKVRATGRITEAHLELDLMPGRTRIEFWPDGSGGVGGFPPGRLTEIDWDGN